MNPKLMKYCPQCGKDLHWQVRGDRERLVCTDEHTCGFVFWNNPTPVVAAIVEHEGDVILARNAAWPPEWYAVITGFLESRESPEAGILREVKEELNLEGEIVEFLGLFPFNHLNQLIIAYHVKATGTIQLSEELIDYKRLKPEQIRPWPGGTGQAMKKWLAARGIFNEEIVFKR